MAEKKPAEVNENALKHRFSRELLTRVAAAISPHDVAFNRRAFLELAPRLAPLEMKARVRLIRDALRALLPSDYPTALAVLMKSVEAKKLEGFDLWPFTEFIQTYGLDHPDLSLKALKIVTTLFTSEWAVRPFLKAHPEKTLSFLLRCAADDDVAVRRWSSEGTRPRLPWGERLQEFIRDPEPTRPILEKLKTDPEIFVRTSVANHLNDIAKDHPDYVIKLLHGWKSAATKTDAAKIEWIAKRALRTLIKNGHPDALAFIGVSHHAEVSIQRFHLKQQRIKIGDRLEFEIEVSSRSAQPRKVVLDYVVHFRKANATTAPKVFKLKTFDLAAGSEVKIARRHHFKVITTRSYYPGQHALELKLNGVAAGKLAWHLDA